MILTTHALTGAVIGKNIGSPWIIIAVSLAVHYLMDGIRHAEYFDDRIAKVKDTWWKVTLDLLVGFSLIFPSLSFLEPSSETIKNIFIAVFFSLIPDFITLLHWTFRKNKILAKIKAFHSLAHRYDRWPKYSPERQWNLKNIINDIIISFLAMCLLLI